MLKSESAEFGSVFPFFRASAIALLRRGLARVAAELVLHPVENAVDEPLGVRAGILLAQVDGLVDRDDRRDVLAGQHLEHREPQDGEVDLGDALELPVVRQGLDVAVELRHLLDGAVDQLLGKGVMLARLVEVLEKQPQVLGQAGRLVDAPRVEILEGRGPALPALGELAAHDFLPKERFSAAISSAACANSAPRLMRPRQRSSACFRLSATMTPLMTGTWAVSATCCRACETLCPTIS